MEQVLSAPVMFLGLSLPEHGYHAPNENFDWEQASGGMIAFAKYFEEIAALGKGGHASKVASKAVKPAKKAAAKAAPAAKKAAPRRRLKARWPQEGSQKKR
jgi:hypothetical protein